MQQWEYRFVSFEPRQPKPDQEPDWYLSYASNQPVPRASAPTIQAYTNQLGAEGWQLFHCHYVPRSSKSTLLRLIFKRPMEGQQATIDWDAPTQETLPTLHPVFQTWHRRAISLFRKTAIRFICIGGRGRSPLLSSTLKGNRSTMKTLQQWLEQALSNPEGSDTGITTIVHVPFSLTLFQGQDNEGHLAGKIALEINFTPGAEEYVLLGQIETAETREAPSPGELPNIVLKAFNIRPDDAIWSDEPL